MKHLTPEHLQKWLDYLQHRRIDPWVLSLEILTRSGARCHELTQLTLTDIDLDHGTLTIQGAKGSNARRVPIDKGCLTALNARLLIDHDIPAMLGLSNVDSLKATLRREFKRALLDCFGLPVPQISLHGLRATFAMGMYSGLDCDILLVKQLLGHKAISSTMYYVHAVNLEERKQDILKVFKTRKRGLQ